jgi:hypothetical protein
MDFDSAYEEYLLDQQLNNATPNDRGCYSTFPDCPFTNKVDCLLWRRNSPELSIRPAQDNSFDMEMDQRAINQAKRNLEAFKNNKDDTEPR